MCVFIHFSFLNNSAITVLLRTITGVYVIPLEYICVVVLCILVINPIVLDTKFVSMKHPKTNQVARVNLVQIMSQPKHLIFNDRVQMDHQRVEKLFLLSTGFGLMYVILSPVSCNFSKLIHINLYYIQVSHSWWNLLQQWCSRSIHSSSRLLWLEVLV